MQRLKTLLKGSLTAEEQQDRWRNLEENPFATSVQELSGRSDDSSAHAQGSGTLAVFPSEDQIDESQPHTAERTKLNEESRVKKTTSVTDVLTADPRDADNTGQPRGAAAFQAAVSAAQEEAKTQLTAAIERVRQEEAERHTTELARVREELERQHADDLQRAQAAVVESFKALTGSVLERV